MDAPRREAVLRALQGACRCREWALLAAQVRTNHVHAVVRAEAKPEKVLNALKAYASRLLNHLELDATGRKRWVRHGSPRWLWKGEQVEAAIRYVVNEQGESMAVYQATAP